MLSWFCLHSIRFLVPHLFGDQGVDALKKMKPEGFKRGNTNPKYFPNFPLISSKSAT